MGLLDLSAAFDCTAHTCGLTDSVIDWVRSFLTDRTQQSAHDSQISAVQAVLFGVQRGSVLGPLLYVLYTAELALVDARHGLNLHQNADGTQIYISTSVGNAEEGVGRLAACLVDIEVWLKASRLRLNPTKTQVMWLGLPQQLAKVNVSEVPAALS